MSMEALRIAAGAGKGMGQKWELAENDPSYRRPSAEILQTIAGLCGVRMDWLEKGDGEMEDRKRTGWGQRIAEAVQMLGGINRLKGTLGGETPKTLQRWMRVGPSNFTETMQLERALQKMGVPKKIHDLAMNSRDDDIRLTKVIASEKVENLQSRTPHIRKTQEWVTIPVYDAKAAAGPGYENGDQAEVVSDVRLTHIFIHNVLRTSPSHLVALSVEGDSMVPTFHPGDVLLIDSKTHREITDGIFLFRQDDSLLVKQLQRLPGGAIQVSSRNPEYPSYTIHQDNAEGFQVIGRVVGKCGRI